MKTQVHKCRPDYVENESMVSGPAITTCYELEDDSLWVENSEYGTRVNFCPFCGFKAKNQITPRVHLIIKQPR